MRELTIERPYILLLLVLAGLPLLARPRRARWRYPALPLVEGRLRARGAAGAFALAARVLAVALVVLALANPRRARAPETIRRPARNIFILIDISRSMTRQDLPGPDGPRSRVEAAQDVVARFLARHEDDRIGLIAFGSSAYTVCPLTFDHGVATHLLDDLWPGVVGDKTAIGDALMLALARLKAAGFSSSLVLLVTDGRNTAGQVDPLQAAQAAQELGVRVYPIGIGPAGAKADEQGEGMDVRALRAIAERTGGRLFLADSASVLADVFHAIGQVHPGEVAVARRPARGYGWMLAVAAGALVLVELVLAASVARTVPLGL